MNQINKLPLHCWIFYKMGKNIVVQTAIWVGTGGWIVSYQDGLSQLIQNAWFHYNTGVQIVNCTLSFDSVLSVPVYVTWYSVSGNEICFDKNISQSYCVVQRMLGQQENSSSPLGDFNRFLEGLSGVLLKTWLWIMTYFFRIVSMWSRKWPLCWACGNSMAIQWQSSVPGT